MAGMEKEVKIWTTREGDKIPITEMGDAHLVNTLNMLGRKQGKYKHPLYDDLLEELRKRHLEKEKPPVVSQEIMDLMAEVKPKRRKNPKHQSAAKKAWETRRKRDNWEATVKRVNTKDIRARRIILED